MSYPAQGAGHMLVLIDIGLEIIQISHQDHSPSGRNEVLMEQNDKNV